MEGFCCSKQLKVVFALMSAAVLWLCWKENIVLLLFIWLTILDATVCFLASGYQEWDVVPGSPSCRTTLIGSVLCLLRAPAELRLASVHCRRRDTTDRLQDFCVWVRWRQPMLVIVEASTAVAFKALAKTWLILLKVSVFVHVFHTIGHQVGMGITQKERVDQCLMRLSMADFACIAG